MNRLDYVDVAKGLGIFIVVLGHCLAFTGLWTSNLFWYIYSFHMPFWFMISGYLYKQKEPAGFIIGKVTSLIVPFVSYFAINIIIYAILTGIGHTEIFHYCSFGAFWFLLTLFLIVIVHYILDYFIYSRSNYPWLIKIIVAISVLFLGLNYANHISDEPNQPVATAFVGYSYFLLGCGMKKLKIKSSPILFTRLLWLLLGLFLSVVLFFTAKFNGTSNVDMNTSRYMNGMLFVANSLLGIFSFSLISLAIERNKVLQNMGRNSLSILMIHIPVCKMFLAACSHFGFRGYLPASLAVIISFVASYIAIYFFKRYMPFMLGKITFVDNNK